MPTKTRVANLKRIQDIYEKLDNQTLVQEELNELVKLSSELYEKALILRFKAAEERVFGTENIKKDVPVEKGEAPKVEAKPKLDQIDFSIFEEKAPEAKPAPKAEIKQEVIEKTETIVEPVKEVKASKESHDWPKRFEKVLKEHASGLQTPLASIAGSFGLNERILYINELFDGEAEKFSACVQKLDSISDWTKCVEALTNYANGENWEMDNDTTDEFVLHVKRKYA